MSSPKQSLLFFQSNCSHTVKGVCSSRPAVGVELWSSLSSVIPRTALFHAPGSVLLLRCPYTCIAPFSSQIWMRTSAVEVKVNQVETLRSCRHPFRVQDPSQNLPIANAFPGFHTGFSVWGGGDVCGIACLMKTRLTL